MDDPRKSRQEMAASARRDDPLEIRKQAAAFRRFNRFYVRKLQPLREAMKGPSLHAAYLRVLRQLGEAPRGGSATWIAWSLNLDPSHVCRILAWFRALGYLEERRDPADGRSRIIALNRRGRDEFEKMEHRAATTAQFMLALVGSAQRRRLIAAMAEIEGILRDVRWDDLAPPH
jgi:DNA-binding MarR family transcriptional regulator